MAYNADNLSALQYANGFTLWHYKTVDTAAAVDTSGYFDAASNMLRVGDMIVINSDTDNSPSDGICFVKSNASGVVDVSDLTTADSDTD